MLGNNGNEDEWKIKKADTVSLFTVNSVCPGMAWWPSDRTSLLLKVECSRTKTEPSHCSLLEK